MLYRGGPSSVQQKKKKNRKGKKKVAAADSDSDSSGEFNFFATGGGTSSGIVSQVRTKAAAGGGGGGGGGAPQQQDNSISTHLVAAFQESMMANPIESVVGSVLNATKGDFTDAVIRDCVGRMFDGGRQYDKTEEVVKQLKAERGDVIKEEAKPAARAQPTATTASTAAATAAVGVETSAEPVPAASTAAAAAAPTSAKAAITSARAAAVGATSAPRPAPAAAPAAAPANPITKYARPGVNDSTGFHAQPMGNKLEIAARHEPLSAGLEALCSWADVVGAEKAPSSFFAPDCHAMEIIALSLVNKPTLASDPKVRVNLTSLMQKMLSVPSAGGNAQHVSKLISDVEAVLRNVQAARAGGGPLLVADGAAARTLADNIAALFRRLYDTIRPATAAGTEGPGEDAPSEADAAAAAIASVEREIKILISRAPKVSAEQGPVSMKVLFAARDAHHEIVGLQKKVLELSTHAHLLEASGVSPTKKRIAVKQFNKGPDIKTISLEQLANNILADVGESTTTLSMKKSQSAAAQSDVTTDGNNSSSGKLREIKLCDDKLSDFLIQKSNLENQMSALERDITLVTTRRDVLRNEYVSLSSQHVDKMSRMAASKAEAERTAQLDASVRAVTSTYSMLDRNVRDIEEELSAIINASSRSEQTAPPPSSSSSAAGVDLSAKKAVSQKAFTSYVSAEVSCIEALTARVVDLRSKQVLKSREIVEYQRIGIDALVQQLDTDLSKQQADCAEDMATIRALQECLVEAVKGALTPADLLAADREGAASPWTPARLLVGRARGVLAGATLPLHPVLAKFALAMPAVGTSSKGAAAPQAAPVSGKKSSTPSTPSTPSKAPVAAWGVKPTTDNTSIATSIASAASTPKKAGKDSPARPISASSPAATTTPAATSPEAPASPAPASPAPAEAAAIAAAEDVSPLPKRSARARNTSGDEVKSDTNSNASPSSVK
jgi:hypothetical protein